MKKSFQWTPARLTSVSFFAIIIMGALLLSLPASVTGDSPIAFIDALFTAVSAVCVTGLIVQDTPTYFSTTGQIIIITLVQIGGLGIMTLSASLPVLFGKQLKIGRRDLMQGMLDQSDYADLKQTLKSIVRYTLIIEGVGAVILSARFYALWGDAQKAIYYGVFHAISGFCNAGFALFSNSLVQFVDDPVITLTIMILILLGGLGFVVLNQLFVPKSLKRPSFHTKFILVATSTLVLLPTAFIFFSEFSGAFLDHTSLKKVMVAFFQIASARTAGFNTVDMASFADSTLFLFCILMFIGGSPGGTAGGVKTTTIGILFLSIRSILLGREQIEVFGRRITQSQVTKAIGIMAISFLSTTVFMILLMMVEPFSFKEIFFEVVSACGTVGLSLGITSELSTLGKFLISLAMFIGRIGPLSLVFLIGSQTEKLYYHYPEGKLTIG